MKLDMSFPEKFRSLIDTREDQVTVPDHVWLSYAVCAVDEDSCGWGGWIIESAWKIVGDQRKAVGVNADTEQRCPECGKPLFRTEVEKQFRFNPDAGPKLDFPYEVASAEFSEEPENSTLRYLTPLRGRTFTFTRWQSPNSEWTHDHCRGCRAHICGSDDNDIHEAFVTKDENDDEDWVCPKCFDAYQSVLNFKIEGSNPAR